MSKTTIARASAIEVLANHQLKNSSSNDRDSHILNWWGISHEDPEYKNLPDALQRELEAPEWTGNPDHLLYDPLILLALRYQYKGVLNSYIEMELLKLGHQVLIEGEMEQLETCPCCGYSTLESRHDFDICKVCLWEDHFFDNAESALNPNHISLHEARLNFIKYGACTESGSFHGKPERLLMYKKNQHL